jgi:hypothetical protein
MTPSNDRRVTSHTHPTVFGNGRPAKRSEGSLDHEDAVVVLSNQARAGSVRAAIALERALRARAQVERAGSA